MLFIRYVIINVTMAALSCQTSVSRQLSCGSPVVYK